MPKPTTLTSLLATAVLLCALPPAAASATPSSNPCHGDLEVQVGPYNNYGCTDCTGSIIVQVGHTNDIECRGNVCTGNLVVQLGVDNSADCASQVLESTTGASATRGEAPCPWPLPPDNFYCFVLDRSLPEEFCLTLDFCLW